MGLEAHPSPRSGPGIPRFEEIPIRRSSMSIPHPTVCTPSRMELLFLPSRPLHIHSFAWWTRRFPLNTSVFLWFDLNCVWAPDGTLGPNNFHFHLQPENRVPVPQHPASFAFLSPDRALLSLVYQVFVHLLDLQWRWWVVVVGSFQCIRSRGVNRK